MNQEPFGFITDFDGNDQKEIVATTLLVSKDINERPVTNNLRVYEFDEMASDATLVMVIAGTEGAFYEGFIEEDVNQDGQEEWIFMKNVKGTFNHEFLLWEETFFEPIKFLTDFTSLSFFRAAGFGEFAHFVVEDLDQDENKELIFTTRPAFSSIVGEVLGGGDISGFEWNPATEMYDTISLNGDFAIDNPEEPNPKLIVGDFDGDGEKGVFFAGGLNADGSLKGVYYENDSNTNQLTLKIIFNFGSIASKIGFIPDVNAPLTYFYTDLNGDNQKEIVFLHKDFICTLKSISNDTFEIDRYFPRPELIFPGITQGSFEMDFNADNDNILELGFVEKIEGKLIRFGHASESDRLLPKWKGTIEGVADEIVTDVGDIDGDGKEDLVTVSLEENIINVFRQTP